MTAAPSVPNMQASGTLRFGFSTAAEFCAADSMPRNAHSVSEMLDPMPSTRLRPCGFQAAANVSRLNQNQPMSESSPTGRMTPQTVTDRSAGHARAAEVGHRGEPEQRDHADAGRDRRRRKPREERREVAQRGDRDRDVADRQRQEVEVEDHEVAGLAVGVLGVGRHAAGALVEEAGLGEAVGDRHRAQRGHDPGQQRDRADLRHVGRQHDDAGAHHVHRDDERQLHQVHLLRSAMGLSP